MSCDLQGGETPLHLAACNNRVNVVQLLVDSLLDNKDLQNSVSAYLRHRQLTHNHGCIPLITGSDYECVF